MRIIAGEFRSRVLTAPKGWETRPTSDRLRETLFNVLQPRIAEARFLDLYAGSGANGLEAVSRGAKEAVLVEEAAPALAAIRANIAALGVAQQVRAEGVAVSRWLGNALRAIRAGGAAYELIFLDPPYAAAEEYLATLSFLGGGGRELLAPGGLVVAEHRRPRQGKGKAAATDLQPPAALADAYGALRRRRLLEQGDAALSFYVPEV